jgi:N utilization substance protein B
MTSNERTTGTNAAGGHERLPEGAVTLAMRRCALQAMYQLDAGQSSDGALVGMSQAETDDDHAPPGDVERGMALAALAWEFHDDADREIATLAREWPPHRQPVVDRNLLRLGWYELRQSSEPPRKVVSDAVELAKEFGTADSGKFVNGVLDKIMNGVSGDVSDDDAAAGDAEAVGEG